MLYGMNRKCELSAWAGGMLDSSHDNLELKWFSFGNINGPISPIREIAVSYFSFQPEVPATNFDQLIFKHELNEVYLMMDFLSGRADKSISSIGEKIPDQANPGKKLTADQVISRIAGICYPPPNSTSGVDSDATFLLIVKDHLNTMIYPAKGLTIAYTIMFTEGRAWSQTSRVKIATDAFPSLIDNARYFRRWKSILSWLGLFVTVISALLLWQVTYGAQLVARFDETKKLEVAATERLYAEMDRGRDDQASWYDLNDVCRLAPAKSPPTVGNSAQDGGQSNSKIQQLCNDYAYRRAQFCVAIADIGRFTQTSTFIFFGVLLPTYGAQAPAQCLDEPGTAAVRRAAVTPPADKAAGQGAAGEASDLHRRIGRQEDAQSVASVLATMSNYILPILFGLVGTVAALVRGIQDKIKESILSPRDFALLLIRLPLGVMAGVCVGLFLSPATLATQTNGTIGAFTISASGIAFLAGYGAEGFFGALDRLIQRVFSFEKVQPPATPRS